jgi:hypothetical protein
MKERYYTSKLNRIQFEIISRLPSKYPENFSVCSSYMRDGKEIPLVNKKMVEGILREVYEKIRPILK